MRQRGHAQPRNEESAEGQGHGSRFAVHVVLASGPLSLPRVACGRGCGERPVAVASSSRPIGRNKPPNAGRNTMGRGPSIAGLKPRRRWEGLGWTYQTIREESPQTTLGYPVQKRKDALQWFVQEVDASSLKIVTLNCEEYRHLYRYKKNGAGVTSNVVTRWEGYS